MATERKTEPKLTEATARTTAVLQSLQARLNRERPGLREETPEDLRQQLKDYFASAASSLASGGPLASADAGPQRPAGSKPVRLQVPDAIRETVIERVVERILSSWEDPNGQLAALKSEVVSRLVERVLAELRKSEIAKP